jgi:ATP-binding cassette subfamily G (WHITE) protein 2 (PDR)
MTSSQQKDDEISPATSQVNGRHSEEILNDPDYESSHDGSSEYDGGSNSRSAGSETISKKRPAFHRTETGTLIDQSDRDELVRIATVLSRRHSVAAAPDGGLSRVHTLITYDEDSPVLDPQSDEFDLEKWLQNFVKTLREQDITAKQTGVAFKDLNVSGTGEAVQVQETVGSVLLAPLRLGEFFSFGKKEHKQILRNFDGLIRSGELLIVLGRPGSGCSTLLKSLCGELHGLSLDEKSAVHYDGIPQKLMKKEFKGEAIYNQEVREVYYSLLDI